MIFSYTTTIMVPELKRRPWWNLFGRDSIVMVPSEERRFEIVSGSEVKFIQDVSMVGSHLIMRLLKAHMAQLEIGYIPSAYIRTESARAAQATGREG